MRFGKAVVKNRILILIVSILLLIPSIVGMLKVRINYDMLTYLPSDIDTMKGQDILMDEFGKGAFSFIVVEGMDKKDVSALREKLEQVDYVDSVIWYDSIMDISVPMELLPDKLYNAFNNGDATMMVVFFDESTSDEGTIQAVKQIRRITNEQCFVAGLSAMVVDLQELCEEQEPIYVGLAVLFSCIAMMLFLDSFLVPFVFLASIGMAILYNLGSNVFFGEISYITKALSAVLQLAVTMDYSIFLWHSYNEQKSLIEDKNEAMAVAIQKTLLSVTGSSLTTVAGFAALCFMSYTLGRDLGLVMAKGVLLGVISCVTILPSLVLVLDKPLEKSKHKSLMIKTDNLAGFVVRMFPVFLVLFVAILIPAFTGYSKTNNEVYYNLGKGLPEDLDYSISTAKLAEDFSVGSTHMVLVDSSLSSKDMKSMINQMDDVDGVKYVLGLQSVVGSLVPEEVIPDSIKSILESDNHYLLLIGSEYKVATDEVNAQINSLNTILKGYDENGMLIGEAPCTKDMIDITDKDFKVVDSISIVAIFIIILLVTGSITLPIILVSVIEFSIFVNLGLAHYTGVSLPFIAPICISTIQLGATVDYAILMTTRYKAERISGKTKNEAIKIALSTSIPSIITSAMGLFAATFGVALYSDIDIISSLCNLMARGAIVSMLAVIFALPAMLMVFDRIVCGTTKSMRACLKSGN